MLTQTQAAVPYRYLNVPDKGRVFSCKSLAPRTLKGGKGGCAMTFEQVVLLLTLIGGVIHLTFEVSWKMFNSNDRKKK